MTFLGFLLDSSKQQVFIPKDKVDRALELINDFLTRHNKKVTLKEVQKLCGVLNFISRCIVPGKAFTRRIYSLTSKLTKPNHHVRINRESALDLATWKIFLEHPNIYARNFTDFDTDHDAIEIDMFTDSAKGENLGCGGICENDWFMLKWDKNFLQENNPSITYLELYAVTIAVVNWIERFKDRKIALFCDNLAAVHMINNNSAKCKNCMVLIRIIVLQGLLHNVRITAKHIAGKANIISDLLSRQKYLEFRKITGTRYNGSMTQPPAALWPISKVWFK